MSSTAIMPTEAEVQAVLDNMTYEQWNAYSWTGGNYTHGNLDVADRKRLVRLILSRHYGSTGADQ